MTDTRKSIDDATIIQAMNNVFFYIQMSIFDKTDPIIIRLKLCQNGYNKRNGHELWQDTQNNDSTVYVKNQLYDGVLFHFEKETHVMEDS